MAFDPDLRTAFDALASGWVPTERPSNLTSHVDVARRDEFLPLGDGGPAAGPTVVAERGDEVVVQFVHEAPTASAVALSASGWWQPTPTDACDFTVAGGRWTLRLTVPRDWRAAYRFLEYRGGGTPPWHETGLAGGDDHPEVSVVLDTPNPRRHRAGRMGEASIISVPWLLESARGGRAALGDLGASAAPDTTLIPIDLSTRATGDTPEVVAEGWVPRDARDNLPLLVLTDGQVHRDYLSTVGIIEHAIHNGALPPLAIVTVSTDIDRGEVLGVPGGHAAWIGDVLVPRLLREGLGTASITTDARRRIVAGASYGGLTALFHVLRTPSACGSAIAQSVSTWRYPDVDFEPALANAGAYRPRIRMHHGRYESDPARSHAIAQRALAHGWDAQFRLVSGGHDWTWWVPELLTDLRSLLGEARSAGATHLPHAGSADHIGGTG